MFCQQKAIDPLKKGDARGKKKTLKDLGTFPWLTLLRNGRYTRTLSNACVEIPRVSAQNVSQILQIASLSEFQDNLQAGLVTLGCSKQNPGNCPNLNNRLNSTPSIVSNALSKDARYTSQMHVTRCTLLLTWNVLQCSNANIKFRPRRLEKRRG